MQLPSSEFCALKHRRRSPRNVCSLFWSIFTSKEAMKAQVQELGNQPARRLLRRILRLSTPPRIDKYNCIGLNLDSTGLQDLPRQVISSLASLIALFVFRIQTIQPLLSPLSLTRYVQVSAVCHVSMSCQITYCFEFANASLLGVWTPGKTICIVASMTNWLSFGEKDLTDNKI